MTSSSGSSALQEARGWWRSVQPSASIGQPLCASRSSSVHAPPTQSRSGPTDPGQVALNPETIQHLHNTLRALPRPLLESLTRAFRKRFEVPDTAVTIADRISQKCHHDWIEAFLVSHREVRSAEQHRDVRPAEQH